MLVRAGLPLACADHFAMPSTMLRDPPINGIFRASVTEETTKRRRTFVLPSNNLPGARHDGRQVLFDAIMIPKFTKVAENSGSGIAAAKRL